MRAIVTVLGKDRVGIMSLVCALLAQHNVNILDISQTILQEDFTMAPATSPSASWLPCWSRRAGSRTWISGPSGRISSTPCTGSEKTRRISL